MSSSTSSSIHRPAAKHSAAVLPGILSLFCFICIWAIAAGLMRAPLILPSPAASARALAKLARQTDFWIAIAMTFLRTMLSFCISVVSGTVLGALCGRSPWLRAFFAFPIELVRAAPVVSFILMALFWFTSGTVPVFVSVLAAFPVMESAVSEGIRRMDSGLLEMARVYRLSRWQQLRWITVPAVLPPFCAGAISAFGLSWKATIAGEVLCLPRAGAGTLMQTAQIHLETADVAAITLVAAGICFAMERGAARALGGITGRAG